MPDEVRLRGWEAPAASDAPCKAGAGVGCRRDLEEDGALEGDAGSSLPAGTSLRRLDGRLLADAIARSSLASMRSPVKVLVPRDMPEEGLIIPSALVPLPGGRGPGSAAGALSSGSCARDSRNSGDEAAAVTMCRMLGV
mmetsp:Transcript_40823/g.129713  ORF Transcript_40823/g.129713 Transcript_40823/m.129713 type:complete len:139 (-) Transcript_40823:209-625(-)